MPWNSRIDAVRALHRIMVRALGGLGPLNCICSDALEADFGV